MPWDVVGPVPSANRAQVSVVGPHCQALGGWMAGGIPQSGAEKVG